MTPTLQETRVQGYKFRLLKAEDPAGEIGFRVSFCSQVQFPQEDGGVHRGGGGGVGGGGGGVVW